MHGSRIFVCDSDPTFALWLKQTLEKRGYIVTGISLTGKETLAQARKERPDLVLMDVKLPGELSGPETARAIYQELKTPVIFLSPVSEAITVQRINASSPYAYITKSRDIVDLVTNIEIALYKHQEEERLRKKEAYYREHLEELVSQRTEELNRANNSLREEIEQRARAEELALLQTAALTSTANAVTIYDQDGLVVWVNPSFTSMTGYASEEVLGQAFGSIWLAQNSTEIIREIRAAVHSGQEWHGEIMLRAKSGARFVEAAVTPVKNAAGALSHYIAIMHDVTSRMRAEEALRDSENRYRLLVENTPMVTAILEQDKIRFINQAGLAMAGLQDAEQIVGKSLFDFIHPDSRAQIAEYYERMLQDTQPVTYLERTWVRPDGAVVELGISAVHISWRNTPHMQIIIQDITARKHLEETLKRQAALGELEISINQPEEPLTVLKRVMKIVDRFVPSHKGSCVVMWERAHNAFWAGFSKLEALEQHTLEHTLLSPDGPSMSVVKSGAPIITPDAGAISAPWADGIRQSGIEAFAAIPLQVEEEVFGVLYILDDVQRAFRREDLEFLTQAAGRIALGIAKTRLVQTLEQARDSAEEANRTKAMFLANVSHELRTPLSAIISLSELLKNTQLDSMQKGFVETIHLSAERLMGLITDLLDFSQIDAKKLKLENRPLELRGIVESTLDLVSAQADEKSLFLGYTIDENVPNNVFGDPVRLGQVLTNLLNNAVKYTDRGYVLLNISIAHAGANYEPYPDGNPEMLRFSVRDTGIGISPERVDTIFDAFTQLEISPKRKREGVGLGLTIARQLVTLMGGEVWVESKGIPGEGCTFSFTLPLITASGPLQPYMLKNHPLLLRKQALIGSPKKVFCDTLAAQVQFWGVETRSFASLHELQNIIRSDAAPDMLLIDHQFIKQRDTDLLFHINELASRIPVLLFTSTCQKQAQELTFEVQGVLRMPIHVPQLYAMLYGMLDHDTAARKSGQEAGKPTEAADLSILIAEDNTTLAKAISLQLEQLGYRPDAVSSGVETLLALEQQPYDIILMDLHMPEMNGTETTRYIRASFPEKAQPYIIALTADTRPEVRGMMLDAGMNDYLSKPVKIQSLQQSIDQALFARRSKNGHFDADLEKSSQSRVETILDESVIKDFMMAMGDRAAEAMSQLIDSYLKNTPPLISSIWEALNAQNWPALRMHVHSLKGNCALFGATSLVRLCKELETSLVNMNLARVEEQVQSIEQTYLRFREVLIQRKASL